MMSLLKKMVVLTLLSSMVMTAPHLAADGVTETQGYAWDQSVRVTNWAPGIVLAVAAGVGIIFLGVSNSHGKHSVGSSGHFDCFCPMLSLKKPCSFSSFCPSSSCGCNDGGKPYYYRSSYSH